jgi:hypothetical protein
MINSDIKTVCIKRMKDIIGVYGENSNLIQVSKENIEKTLQKIADVRIKANVAFSTTVKHALYNLENFRPEIRSACEKQLFNVWYNAFKTGDIELSDDIEPEILPPVVMEISEVEEILEEPVVAKEPEPEPEPEVEEILEEPVVAKEPEPEPEVEVEEILEEPAVAEEPEPEVEEIAEEPVVAEEPEPEVEEIAEEPVVAEDPDLLEKEIPIKSVEEQERQTVEKRSEILEQSLGQAHEEEVSLKRHKRDWFDLILDISAAVMNFFMRIVCKRLSRK